MLDAKILMHPDSDEFVQQQARVKRVPNLCVFPPQACPKLAPSKTCTVPKRLVLGLAPSQNAQFRVAPSCLRCCFFETTRAAFMCSCILYMHISAHAHIHIQAHSLMGALTLSCARTRARTRMHMQTTHTGARAQTRMHPGTRGPDYTRTHAPAHEHACMRTHTRKHTRTCTHAHAPALRTCTQSHASMRPHNVHACIRTRHMQACTRTKHMHVDVRARANTPAHAHALVQTHAHIFWLRANRLGSYSSAVSCV